MLGKLLLPYFLAKMTDVKQIVSGCWLYNSQSLKPCENSIYDAYLIDTYDAGSPSRVDSW